MDALNSVKRSAERKDVNNKVFAVFTKRFQNKRLPMSHTLTEGYGVKQKAVSFDNIMFHLC